GLVLVFNREWGANGRLSTDRLLYRPRGSTCLGDLRRLFFPRRAARREFVVSDRFHLPVQSGDFGVERFYPLLLRGCFKNRFLGEILTREAAGEVVSAALL